MSLDWSPEIYQRTFPIRLAFTVPDLSIKLPQDISKVIHWQFLKFTRKGPGYKPLWEKTATIQLPFLSKKKKKLPATYSVTSIFFLISHSNLNLFSAHNIFSNKMNLHILKINFIPIICKVLKSFWLDPPLLLMHWSHQPRGPAQLHPGMGPLKTTQPAPISAHQPARSSQSRDPCFTSCGAARTWSKVMQGSHACGASCNRFMQNE